MRVFGLPDPLYRVSGAPPAHLNDKAKEHWRYVSCWQTLAVRDSRLETPAKPLESPGLQCTGGCPGSKLTRPADLEYKSRRPTTRRRPEWSPGVGPSDAGASGAASQVGQGQAAGPACPRGLAGLSFHRGTDRRRAEEEGHAERTSQVRGLSS